MSLINWRIAAQPLNWLTFILMVGFALLGFHLIAQASGKGNT